MDLWNLNVWEWSNSAFLKDFQEKPDLKPSLGTPGSSTEEEPGPWGGEEQGPGPRGIHSVSAQTAKALHYAVSSLHSGHP